MCIKFRLCNVCSANKMHMFLFCIDRKLQSLNDSAIFSFKIYPICLVKNFQVVLKTQFFDFTDG